MAEQKNRKPSGGGKITIGGRTFEQRQVIQIVAAAVLVVCIILISAYFFRWNKNKTLNEQVAQIAVDAIEDDLMDFTELKALNPDIYAYIMIPGTNVNYPILQHEGDGNGEWYYLERTVDGQEGLPGSLFSEPRNAQDFSDPVAVVYGHNMRDGSMFATLHEYSDLEFMKENPYVYVYTPEKNFIYQIFSSITYDDRLILDRYADFEDTGLLEGFIAEMTNTEAGTVNTDVPLDEKNQFLTLSTCTSAAYGEDTRFVVNAVMLSDSAKQELLRANEASETPDGKSAAESAASDTPDGGGTAGE